MMSFKNLSINNWLVYKNVKKASQSGSISDGIKQKIVKSENLEPPNIWYLEGRSTDQ